MQIKTEDIYSLNPSSIRSNLLFCVSCLPLPNINFTAVPRTQIWLYSPEFTLYMKTVAFPEMLYGFWLSFLKDSKKRMCCNLLSVVRCFIFLPWRYCLIEHLCCTAFVAHSHRMLSFLEQNSQPGESLCPFIVDWPNWTLFWTEVRDRRQNAQLGLSFWALLSSLISDSSWHLFTVVGTAPNGGHLWTADLILWIVGYKLGNSTGWRGGFWAECLIRA